MGPFAVLYQQLKLPSRSQFGGREDSWTIFTSLQASSYRPAVQSSSEVEKSKPLLFCDEQSSSGVEKSFLTVKKTTRKSSVSVFTMVASFVVLTGLVALTRASYLEMRAASSSASVTGATSATSATVPQYFQTSPELYAGKLHVRLYNAKGPAC